MKKFKVFLIQYWSDGELYPSGYMLDEELAKEFCKKNYGHIYVELDKIQ